MGEIGMHVRKAIPRVLIEKLGGKNNLTRFWPWVNFIITIFGGFLQIFLATIGGFLENYCNN
jgi:hypothetical protein